ncbi:MAG: thioredoxin domain-containing protein [Patescibacteria group bacterium]|jgi:protein-disulfide isomerase
MENTGGKLVVSLLIICGAIGAVAFGYVWWSSNKTVLSNANPVNNLGVILPTIDNDPAMGNAKAPMQIIAFEDFQCPYCEQAYAIERQLVQKYPNDILFVYRDFPLTTLHAQAWPAALAANCANEQNKFWAYHDLMFAEQKNITQANIFQTWADKLKLNGTQFASCLSSQKYQEEVQQDFDAGVLAGVDRTPTYFVNGVKLTGVYTLEEWEEALQTLQ